MASERSLGLAAQAWCTERTKHIVMISDLAEAFAEILDREQAESSPALESTPTSLAFEALKQTMIDATGYALRQWAREQQEPGQSAPAEE